MIRPANCMGIRGSQGRLVDLVNPSPDSFQPEEIARALSLENRYAGNYGPYSVAQHAVLVAEEVESLAGNVSDNLVLAALHHDDTEAVTGDVPRPVKNLCPEFRALERRLEQAVEVRYGISIKHPAVKAADMAVFASEVHRLVPPDARWIYLDEIRGFDGALLSYVDLVPWGPDRAFARYMDMHVRYGGKL